MAAVSAAQARASFDLKSASLPLVSLLLKTADTAELADALAARFGDTPDFFDNDPLVLDLALLPDGAASPDFAALLPLLRRYRMQPLAVRGGNQDQIASALAAGLVLAPDLQAASEPQATASEPAVREVVREVPVAGPATRVIDRPLRSGQQVYAKGGDLVVLAAVNHGAEVIADGNVHVYAPLRGKAIAGARGNENARIFTTCLEPELVAIAGIYRTTENPIPADVLGKAAQIRLVGEKLVMEPL